MKMVTKMKVSVILNSRTPVELFMFYSSSKFDLLPNACAYFMDYFS